MNILFLAYASIRSKILHSSLNIIAFALGISLLTAALLLSAAIQDGITRNSYGIDVVVGAKGGATQLVLSTIYHSDIPNGNIEMSDYEALLKNQQIKEAIPMAIGDNFRGWRIIGTTPAYLTLYHASIREGKTFEEPFEAVVGSKTNLKIGQEFAPMHGFSAESGDVHDSHLYKVVGVLKQSGTVLDKLIITSFQSIQESHEHDHEHGSTHDEHEEESDPEHQITAVLIKTKSPIAKMNLPREINQSTNLQAVSPSYQMANLLKSFGFGRDVFVLIAFGTISLSTLMLLSNLASSLANRRYDLAVLRILGAKRHQLLGVVIFEGVMLSIIGSITGLLLGRLAAASLVISVPNLGVLVNPNSFFSLGMYDLGILAIGTLAGVLGGIVPAISLARSDLARILAKGKS